MKRRGLLAVALMAAAAASARAGWPEAADYSAAHGERALLVSERGRVLLERGPALVQAPRIFSITKSLVSIGVFRDAMKGGLSLGQSVSHPAVRGVRLADLLNQTSGLAPMSGAFYSQGLADKNRILRRLESSRGWQGFAYGASHWEVLAEEILLVKGAPLEGWVRRFIPGAKPEVVARWRRDGQGRMFFSTGARLSARELLPAAREALVGMGRGRHSWPGEVRALLSSGTRQNAMYALGFWLNRAAARTDVREVDVEESLAPPQSADFWRHACLSRAAPPDLLAMIGSGGQRVYVVPSRGLIVVRLGSGGRFSDAEFLGKFFSSLAAEARG